MAELLNELQEYVKKETKNKIPILFHEEAITGVALKGAVIFPQMIGMSCSWNPDLVYENARITGKNMDKIGACHALSPMMDVITDARWGRGEEGFGEDAYLVLVFASAFIKGLQEEGVAATAKHFAGYGVENQEVVGPNADSCYSLLGDYTWGGISEYFHRNPISREKPHLVTLLEALKERLGYSCDISYERGCEWDELYDDVKETLGGDARGLQANKIPLEENPYPDRGRAMELGMNSDVIIAAMGENRYLCGECCNRENVELPGEQEQFVTDLCELGKPVILIIFGGRPLAIEKIAEKCAAVLYAWYPGEEGGNAVVDILTGAVNPSAKLTVTLPATTEELPVHYQKDGENHGKYCFGFGMSYTKYEYPDLIAPKNVSLDQAYFDISFKIRNVGEYDGKETAQVYVVSEDGRKKLVGFSKEEVKKGETKEINLRFYLDMFARYDKSGDLYLEPHKWIIQIGSSSKEILLSTDLALEGERKKIKEKIHFTSENR